MGDRSRRALLRQAEPGAPLPEQLAPLARCLFPLLHPGGPVAAHDLEHLRRLLRAASASFDALWRAATDAVSDDPVYSTEALKIDIARHGQEGAAQLDVALAEVDVLADVIRKGGEHVA